MIMPLYQPPVFSDNYLRSTVGPPNHLTSVEYNVFAHITAININSRKLASILKTLLCIPHAFYDNDRTLFNVRLVKDFSCQQHNTTVSLKHISQNLGSSKYTLSSLLTSSLTLNFIVLSKCKCFLSYVFHTDKSPY